jgi:hypothetical protein
MSAKGRKGWGRPDASHVTSSKRNESDDTDIESDTESKDAEALS